MSAGCIVGVLLAVAAIGALATVIARFNVKRLHIKKAGDVASPELVEEVWREIESISEDPPQAGVLVRSNRAAVPSLEVLAIPRELHDFPWAGWSLRPAETDQFHLGPGLPEGGYSNLGGLCLRTLLVPRFKSKSGQVRNAYAPEKFLRRSERLLASLSRICPRYPRECLSYLMAPGLETFEFDGLNQVKIGGSPTWAQGAAFPLCTECSRKARFVAQIPGAMLPSRRSSEATFYIFSCASHPETATVVVQYT